jgi:hypothetical protein
MPTVQDRTAQDAGWNAFFDMAAMIGLRASASPKHLP